MHFHLPIHVFLHYLRHARLLGINMRFAGSMLFMLLFSLLQFVIDTPASAMFESFDSREKRQCTICVLRDGSTTALRGETASSGDADLRGMNRTNTFPPCAIAENTHSSVFRRLQPGIFLIPRKDRVPKPKSVYRLSTRAPGPTTPVL